MEVKSKTQNPEYTCPICGEVLQEESPDEFYCPACKKTWLSVELWDQLIEEVEEGENDEMKVKFNHDAEYLSEALGLSEERTDELAEVIFSEAAKLGKNYPVSRMVEAVIKNCKNLSELIWASVIIGKTLAKAEMMADEMAFVERLVGLMEGWAE